MSAVRKTWRAPTELRYPSPMAKTYDPSEPRDEQGRWTSGADISGSDLGTIYHGGKEKIRTVDASRLQSRDSGFYGTGFYAASKPEYTRGYGGRVSAFRLPDDAHVLNASLKPSEAPQSLRDAVVSYARERGAAAAAARGKTAAFEEELSSITSDNLAWKNAVDRFAEAKGYDAIRYSDAEILVKHPERLIAVKKLAKLRDPYARPRLIGSPKLVAKTWRSPTEKAGPQDAYAWLLAIADDAAPDVRDAFIEAVNRVRGTAAEADLVRAVETGSVDRVMQALGLDAALREALGTDFQTHLQDEFLAAGRAAPNAIGANISFDLTNPASLAFLRSYEFGLITQVTRETTDAIREVVLDAFSNGGHPYQQARRIRELIGLTTRQAQAAENYRATLLGEDRPLDQVDRMASRYSARLLRQRAENIARTETLRAANAGLHAATLQAADEGLLDRATDRRWWLITPDDRLCPYCAVVPAMNPTGVALDGYFATPFGPVMYPPLHPQCRCTTTLGEGDADS